MVARCLARKVGLGHSSCDFKLKVKFAVRVRDIQKLVWWVCLF